MSVHALMGVVVTYRSECFLLFARMYLFRRGSEFYSYSPCLGHDDSFGLMSLWWSVIEILSSCCGLDV